MASITADLLKNTHTPKPVSQHLSFSLYLFVWFSHRPNWLIWQNKI